MALESIAISIALGSVKLLLNEVLVEVGKPLWEGDKYAKMLRHLLQCIDPVISTMDAPGATPEQLKWLQEVEPCLKDIQRVLHSHEECKFTSKLGTSRELMKKMQWLRELCQTEVPVMTMHNSNVILQQLSSMGELLKDMKEQMEGLELERDKGFQDSKQVVGMATSCRHQDTYTTFGREHDIVVEVAIQELLVDSKATSRDDVECVGIWGLGGSGKTLAATRVFNKEEIQAHFRGGCYWVTVGSSKTSIPKLLGEIYKKMVHQHHAHVGDEDIKDELFRGLKGQERMLLVLDDVWKTQTLEILEVMPKGVQCKVLITTRNEGILNKIHATKLKMPNLSPEESWKLFCHHACRGDANMPLDLERVGRQIANECGGLPLALKVTGGYLAGSIDPSYWERTLNKLKNASMVSSDQDKQLYSKLQLSVDELEKVHPRLKDSFFYFAAFPEDYEVDVEQDLFPLWLGDQIVGKKDPMGDAKELLDILVQRSLIEVRGYELYGQVHYVIHDVLRDLIRHMLQKLPLERRECLYEAGQDLECFPEEYQKMLSPTHGTLSAQRLSIMDSKVEKLPPKLLNAPKLQVMMLRDNAIEAIPAGFFSGNFRNLRVLDLSTTKIRSLPKSVKNLKQLVVLNLRCAKLEKLSSSFVKAMTNLQVLNVDFCELEYLPSSIASLSKLQYLYAYSENDLWKEVGGLRNALHLRATLADIMKLVLLEELEISIQSQEVLPEGMFKALKHLRVLRLERCYKLSAIPEPMEDELQHLQVLSICESRSLTSLPNSFGIVLKNLRDLILFSCTGLLLCLPEGLAGLPKLKNLDISWCKGLECFPSSFSRPGAFPALKRLKMCMNSSRVSFPDLQPGAMPQLEYLGLQGWEQLVDFPKAIANLTKLRILGLSGCGNLRSLEHDGVGVQSLANLEELYVGWSQKISTLPDGLEALPKLRRIDISLTKITFSQEVSHLVTRGYE